MMQTLDYGSDRPQIAWSYAHILLLGLAVPASLLTVIFNAHWLAEPFGIYRRSDAVVLVGLPSVAIGIWCLCLILAIRRPRLPWFVLLPGVCWILLSSLSAVNSITRYLFREPWTNP